MFPLYQVLEKIVVLLPLFGTISAVLFLLWGAYWILLQKKPELRSEQKFSRQILMLALGVVGLVVVALALPVDQSTRNQIIGLIGILISGILAFSSTTIIGNLMAGVMPRITMPFKTGDFIRIGDHFGRVAERGLFDTEIQTDHRELVALPNSYLISKPVTVVRSSGTIISINLSLGYDTHHSRIEELLSEAAREAGLDDPFVQLIELGDHAITYRVSGLLSEVKELLTARSNLARKVLDHLHGEKIEIVSPSFVNQRRLAEGTQILPSQIIEPVVLDSTLPEAIVFDKAEQAEQKDKRRQLLETQLQELKAQLASVESEGKPALEESIKHIRQQIVELESPAPNQDPQQGGKESPPPEPVQGPRS